MAAAAARDPAAARAAVTAADPLRRLTPVVRVAPAKLNLTLAVLGRRADGFHDAAQRDGAARPGGPDQPRSDLERPGSAPRRGRGPRGRAGETSCCAPSPRSVPGWGGSARRCRRCRSGWRSGSPSPRALAAAAAMRRPRSTRRSRHGAVDLEAGARTRTAAAVGSDVPFFFAGNLALVTGRGESVDPAPGAVRPAARHPARHSGDRGLDGSCLRRVRRRLGVDPADLGAPRPGTPHRADLEGAARPRRDPRRGQRPRARDRR